MKKKTMCYILIFALMFIGAIIYFIPMKVSDCLENSSQISIIMSEMGVRDGKPFIEPINYSDITEEQNEAIFTLCSQYTYRRTIRTWSSDGSITEIGDKIAYIYGNDENSIPIILSSSGKISVNNKTFKMKHAERFMEQLIEILEKQ